MRESDAALPNDPEALRAMLAALASRIDEQDAVLAAKQAELEAKELALDAMSSFKRSSKKRCIC